MTSEIRTNTLKNRVGLGTISLTSTGPIVSGISTFSGDVQIDGDELFIADSIKHIGDTDTLISFPSNDTINFRTGGSERLRIRDNGKVIINDTNSDAQLGVYRDSYNVAEFCNRSDDAAGAEVALRKDSSSPGNGDTLGLIKFVGDDSIGSKLSYSYIIGKSTDVTNDSEDGELQFHTRGDGTIAERLRITSGGKVGINENNPSGKLEVKSTGATAVFNSGAASDGRLEFEYNSSRVGLLAYHSDRLEIQTDSSKDFTIRTGGANERLRITSDGKFGMGTTNPDGLLTIQGNSDATTTPSIRLKDGTDTREVSITNTAGDFLVSTHGTDNTQHGYIKLFESGIFSVATGGTTERLRIASDGRATFTGTNEQDIIHITTGNTAGNTFANIRGDNEAGIRIRGGGSYDGGTIELAGGLRNTDPGIIKFSTGTGASVTEKLRITSTGQVNIGGDYDQTTYKMKVTGTVAATNFDSLSDQKLKINIEKIKSPIETVNKIDGVTFDWKEDNSPSMGVIAQNVEKVLPEIVSGDDTKSVNYSGLIGLLIEVVKDQQKQIDELRDRLDK